MVFVKTNPMSVLKKILLFILIIVSLSFADDKVNLIGIWQDAPEIASGWSDTYQIFPDGTFKFNYNQMKCDKQVISFMGNWKTDDSGTLILSIDQKVIVEGGTLVPSTGSCASEYEIEGGTIKTIWPDSIEIKEFKLSQYHIDTENNDLETIRIGDKQFWKMEKDPSGYK